MSTGRPCASCGKKTTLRCSRCHTVSFCSKDCFKAGWKKHKSDCSQLQAINTSKLIAVLLHGDQDVLPLFELVGEFLHNGEPWVEAKKAGGPTCGDCGLKKIFTVAYERNVFFSASKVLWRLHLRRSINQIYRVASRCLLLCGLSEFEHSRTRCGPRWTPGAIYGLPGYYSVEAYIERRLIELIQLGADVNATGMSTSPLLLATQASYENIVRILLLHPSIDVNKAQEDGDSGSTPLYWAALSKDRVSIFHMLLAHPSIDANKMGESETGPIAPLQLLVSNGGNMAVDLVRALLSHPEIDVNCQGSYNDAPLLACLHGKESSCIEIVKLLLAHPKIDPMKTSDSEYDDGENALITALQRGYTDILELLLAHPRCSMSANELLFHAISATVWKRTYPPPLVGIKYLL